MNENDRDRPAGPGNPVDPVDPVDPMDIGGLYMDRVPRDSLEDEVVRELAARGAFARPRPAVRTWGLQAAAAVLLFLSGWGSAQLARPDVEAAIDPAPETGGVVATAVGQQYMLLLWEGPEFQADQSLAEQYGAWGRGVGESGVPISGEELAPTRRMFGPTELPTAEPAAFPGPPSEYRLGGYFMVGGTEDLAAELASSHPHRTYGGWVEVAPVVAR